ncbi:hypothetical protein DFJ74DRAFT_402202 [Hyaloraphidium curvatum]|nr:hypothetical protein DFJ74DRAFT_402202 [Hyaloraphidium curvatum]
MDHSSTSTRLAASHSFPSRCSGQGSSSCSGSSHVRRSRSGPGSSSVRRRSGSSTGLPTARLWSTLGGTWSLSSHFRTARLGKSAGFRGSRSSPICVPWTISRVCTLRTRSSSSVSMYWLHGASQRSASRWRPWNRPCVALPPSPRRSTRRWTATLPLGICWIRSWRTRGCPAARLNGARQTRVSKTRRPPSDPAIAELSRCFSAASSARCTVCSAECFSCTWSRSCSFYGLKESGNGRKGALAGLSKNKLL